jgi:hypothetical protein
MLGAMSLIDPFDGAQLLRHTQQVYANSPYRDSLLQDAGIPAGNPVPTRIGDPSPIRHVIYIVKENRTYDQVFGGLKRGNGGPSLVLFGADSSINHRKLAEEFVLFDNFYVNGDVSADGHNWSAGAIAPDMTNKLWPNLYSGRRAKFSLYWGRPPLNHTEDAARPHGGYLWTRAFEAGLTVRNYGWMTKLRQEAKTGEDHVIDAESKQLLANTNRLYRPYDVRYPDVDRMDVFLRDLQEFGRKGEMPRLIVMRLGNDHTAGLAPGARSPRAMFADNDLALGRLVEAVSKSRFWNQTAIFVLEDDAQAGPDHVDSHRSIAFVISPYSRRNYTAGMPGVSRNEMNPARGELAARSLRMDLEEAGRIEDREMNDILYLAIQGRPTPPPVRSAFLSRRPAAGLLRRDHLLLPFLHDVAAHRGKDTQQRRLFGNRHAELIHRFHQIVHQGVELHVADHHPCVRGFHVTALIFTGAAGAGANLVDQVLAQGCNSGRAGHGLREEAVDAAVGGHIGKEVVDNGRDRGQPAQARE